MSMDLSPDDSPLKPRKKEPAAKPRKPKAPKELTPVKVKVVLVTKRRSATTGQARKAILKKEKALVIQQRPPKTISKLPKPVKRKRAPEPDSGDSDVERDFSPSDEEREVVIQNARRRLETLLDETTSLVDELQRMEDDVQRLQEEKLQLLDELLVCEGLAVNPYPSFRPLSRKIKLIRH